jgi:hypothetical protein
VGVVVLLLNLYLFLLYIILLLPFLWTLKVVFPRQDSLSYNWSPVFKLNTKFYFIKFMKSSSSIITQFFWKLKFVSRKSRRSSITINIIVKSYLFWKKSFLSKNVTIPPLSKVTSYTFVILSLSFFIQSLYTVFFIVLVFCLFISCFYSIFIFFLYLLLALYKNFNS